jgi:hypothetical protein
MDFEIFIMLPPWVLVHPRRLTSYNILNGNVLYLSIFKKKVSLKTIKIMDLFTTRFMRHAQNNNSNELN